MTDLGKIGMTTEGAYNSDTTYEKLDVVSYDGGSYTSRINNNRLPLTNPLGWQLIASKGDIGATGAKGDTGYKTIDPDPVKISDPAPTVIGWYKPETVGVYPNLGGIEALFGYETLFFFNGTIWTKTETKLPEADPDKILFQKSISVNIFNRENLIPNKYISYTDGKINDLDGYNATDFILIDPNEVYTASVDYQIAFYDENKIFISGIATPTTFTTPINAKYYRTAVNNPDKGVFTLTKDTKISVLPEYNKGYSDAAVYASNVVGIDLNGVNKLISNKDLFDKNNVNIDTYVSYTNGKILRLTENNVYSSKPIKVNSGKIYEFGDLDNQQYAWYDSNGIFIKGYAPSIKSKFITSPWNAEYIVFTGNSNKLNKQSLIERKNVSLYGKWAENNGKYVSYSTGDIEEYPDFSASEFIPVTPNNTYEFGDIKNQQYAWYDENKQYISGYAGSISGYIKKVTSPNGAKYIRFTTGINDLDSQYLIELGVDDVKVIKITAVQNGANWCSIREIANNIKDSSRLKKYEIYVPNGTWNETDWAGWGPYISIHGQDRYLTIINSNGSDSINVIPNDYWGAPNSGKKLSELPHDEKHLIFLRNDIQLYNLTLKASSSKYVAHIDYDKWNNAIFHNCNIEETGDCNFVFGVGIWQDQNINLKYCKIIRPLGNNSSGIFIHNWTNQNKDTNISINGCRFINCKYLWLEELGSGRNDTIILENCKSDQKEIHYGLSSGISDTAPYSIHLVVSGTDVTTYDIGTGRSDFYNKSQV